MWLVRNESFILPVIRVIVRESLMFSVRSWDHST
ncbi:unnamed protein product [Anisakis simplex]|uniref:Uncharacterized protein n=1 Tax=Anisakis simplex TaxID=6269 RepID=A0A3P6QLL7_ANISI|nr:unnamed protein product [Anisakis simplex]VDK32781.1 unnamed protein product [Anisakis simplex]